MKCLILILTLCGASLLAACSTTPKVSVNYYLPQAKLAVTATRLVRCDAVLNPIVSTTVTTKTTYSPYGSPHTIDVAATSHFYADADLAITLTEDGRLSGINSTSAGQGGAIVKSAVSVGVALAALDQTTKGQNQAACDLIARQMNGAKDKDYALNYARVEDFARPIDVYHNEIEAVAEQKSTATALQQLIGKLCLEAANIVPAGGKPGDKRAPRASYAGKWEGVVKLDLVQPAEYRVSVKGPGPGGEECQATLWTDVVYVPQDGTAYSLPIPRAALFGNHTFKLSLSDSGQITSIEYGNTSGTSAALDSAQSVEAALKRDTPADTAAELKGKADAIAQQERLSKCQKDASSCT